MRILLVEDDEILSQILTEHLTAQHYVVDAVGDGVIGFDYAQAAPYDLIVLDVNLPQLDGIQLCQRLRQNRYTTPILLLTAKAESSLKVMGLDAGADDYVVKPCTVKEISARIRALLRRPNLVGAPVLSWGTLCLDPVSYEVTCNGQPLSLSPKEYSLLELFLRYPQRTFSSSSILEHLWSFEDAPTEETVRSHIKRLRRKLKTFGHDDLIDTVYGMGYRLKSASMTPASPPQTVPVQLPATPHSTLGTSLSPEDEARATAITLWQQFQHLVSERTTILDQAVVALEAGYLPDALRLDAAHAAHKLVGSLAMFGFPAATSLARSLEQLLHTFSPPTGTVKNLVNELHSVLQSPQTTTAADSVPSPTQPLAQPHLLVIDNNTVFVQQIQAQAEILNLSMQYASGLAEAQIFLATGLPGAILLDLDILLAADDGPAFLAQLQEQSPQIPILALLQHDDFANRLAGFRLGCDHLIARTTAPDKILMKAQHLLNPLVTRPIKVLAVDDDLLILKQLNQGLRTQGIDLIPLNTPDSIWQMLETTQPDLLILDVEMPSLNGIDLCRLIRTDPRLNKLPILFLTAHRDPDVILKLYKAGADDYLSKPFTDPEIITRIFNRLARCHPVEQPLA